MIEFIAIEVIAAVSFLYAVLLSIFYVSSSVSLAFAFVWTLVIALLYATVSRKHNYLKCIALLLLAPIYYFNTFGGITFFVLTAAFLVAHIEYNLYQNNIEYRFVVKNTYGVFAALFGVWIYLSAFPNDALSRNLTMSFPFIMGYILVSIILVRSQRHIKSNMPLNTIRSSNFIFSIVSLFIFSSLFMKEARNTFVRGLTNTLENIAAFLLSPIYALFENYALDGLVEAVDPNIIEATQPLNQAAEIIETGSVVKPDSGFDWFNLINFLLEKTLFILLVLFIIWTMIRLSKILFKGEQTEDAIQTVEKSFLFRDEKNKSKKNLFERFLPKTPLDQIRYYYRKHLHDIENQEVILEPQDTSQVIAEKALKKGFDHALDIRGIYVEARYSDIQISTNQVERMKKLYAKK